jgi:cobalt-zinc-cadmium efflux system membrane fusion protein
LAIAGALAFMVAVAGCDRATGGGKGAQAKAKAELGGEDANKAGGDEHGHDHAAKGGAKGEGDEHGHDHAHGEHADEVKLTPEAIRANGIKVAAAEKRTLVGTFTAPARVAFDAERMAHVGSIVKGRVAELKARVGDTVKRGDVLIIVDSAELGEAQSDHLQKHTAVEIAKSAVDLAKDAYERAKALYDKTQGISLSELQKRQGEYQANQGALGTATAALVAAENRLQLLGVKPEEIQALAKTRQINAKYAIHAPIDGQVVEREVTLGELVAPEKERLLTLADLRTVWVLVDVPEGRLAQVGVGAAAKLTVPAAAGQTFEGKVSYILAQLDPTTRTARARVEVANPDLKLRPGMFATAEVTSGEAAGPTVAVPEGAVQTVEGEPAVFVPHASEANTFQKRQVGVGPSVDGMVPVFAGLKEGEKYVAAGSFILKAEIGKEGAAHEH